MARELGVLVAGGRGSRLGAATPKALVPLGGVPLLERALAILSAVCDEVVVVAPAELALPAPGARRVNDPPGASGPLAGVVAGLGARGYERAIVLGVDFPFVPAAALAALRERLGARAAVVPAPAGVLQPLAAAYAPRAHAALAAALARGARALTAAVRALDPVIVAGPELEAIPGGAAGFFNLNTPADRDAAERRLGSREIA